MMDTKTCSRCHVQLPLSSFSRQRTRLLPHCKACERVAYQKNKDKILAQKKLYRQKTKQQSIEYSKEYSRTHRQQRCQWARQRYREDVDYKLRCILRSRLTDALCRMSKAASVVVMVGCDMGMLRLWLEWQFTREMTWENQGSFWHIDHVLPVSKFNLADASHQQQSFHWTNLQPLAKGENLAKRDKIVLVDFFNVLISAHRFIQAKKNKLPCVQGYQTLRENVKWLRCQPR